VCKVVEDLALGDSLDEEADLLLPHNLLCWMMRVFIKIKIIGHQVPW
jgi:hypothetical protein